MHHSWVFTAAFLIVYSIIGGIGKHLAWREERRVKQQETWADYERRRQPAVKSVTVVSSERL